MKAFSLTGEQMAAVTAALIVNEIVGDKSAFRAIDISQNPAIRLGEGGFGLNENERRACLERTAGFFGRKADDLGGGALDNLEMLASALSGAIGDRLLEFAFMPAGGKDAQNLSVHSAAIIFEDAAGVANLLYGRRRIISLVSPHSLIGLTVTVLAANLQRIDWVDARTWTPAEISERLRFGDAIVATPSLWRYLVREGVKAPDNAVGVYFGEAMPQDLAADMRKAGFGAQREIYGSTETALVAWRDSPSDPFRLFDVWRTDGERLLRRMPNGSEAAFTPMDRLEWINERSFRLGGRRDGAVQVGAVNVFPDRIAAAIAEMRQVRACNIEASTSRTGATKLIAEIELENGAYPNEHTARAIDAWCRSRLRPQERPQVYRFVEDK